MKHMGMRGIKGGDCDVGSIATTHLRRAMMRPHVFSVDLPVPSNISGRFALKSGRAASACRQGEQVGTDGGDRRWGGKVRREGAERRWGEKVGRAIGMSRQGEQVGREGGERRWGEKVGRAGGESR